MKETTRIVNIEYCGDCPNSYFVDNDRVCNKTNKVLGADDTRCPEWCPLPVWHGESKGEWQPIMKALLDHWLHDSNPDELQDFVDSVKSLLPQEKQC